ncbi:MAG: hypothetical protein J0I07_26865 [Myxococcales bacterium]|nr:hypothetical protein [Myxococcales bacterium]
MTRMGLAITFVSVAAVVIASASCAGTERSFPEQQPVEIVPPEAGALEEPPSCEGLRCSRDMKNVVDGCTGDVVTECGPDKGCANGSCVDPCTAAEVSKGSVGCSFWTLPPDEPLGSGSCFAAMIANTWDRPVTITADYGTTPLDLGESLFTAEMIGSEPKYTKLEGPLPPGQVALVFLSEVRPAPKKPNFSACPLGTVGAFNGSPLVHGTAITSAFSIKTDAPVSLYSIYPYGGAKTYIPTATLVLPTSSWSDNYIAVNGWPPSRNITSGELVGGPSLQIVAMSDDTEVRMRPKIDVYDGAGVTGGGAGQPLTWRLARGQVLQITQPDELTGSPIQSNKPVGLFGGAKCTFVPESVMACDSLQQQIPPLAQWGHEYALVPFHSRLAGAAERREVVPYRLVGAVDGTALTYDPKKPRDAPSVLRAGEVVSFMTDDLVVVKSQDADHPFYAAVMMTGAVFNGGYTAQTDGDPDFVNIVPTEQFLDRYVFFADYTFPETTLTLVRRKTASGFKPVELDCVGEVQGFQPLGVAGEYEYGWVDLTKNFASATGTCGAGRREAKSDGPFSVTVWGMGYAASYGYAGGTGSRPLTKVEAPVIVN